MIKFCFLLPWVFNKTKFAETVVRLGPTISETMKRKLINGHGILEIGGFKRFFWKIFSVEKEKNHLKAASPCFFQTVKGFCLLVYGVCELSEIFQLCSTSNISSPKSTLKVIQADAFFPL